MSEDVFQQYSAYYDLLYRDKDYAGEAAYVGELLRRSQPDVKTLAEFGSGTGKHGRLLAEQGFYIVGVERSASMAAVASQAAFTLKPVAGSFRCTHGDINSIDLGEKFDAVASLFHVVSYQTGNDDVLRTFANAARHLRQGGIFVFDVWHGPAVLSERPAVRVKRVEDEKTRLIRIAEPVLDVQTGTVLVRYTMLAESKEDGQWTKFGENHYMRYFFPTEIDLLARQTGFGVERSEEFLTGHAPSERTWGVAYVLRKQ